MSIKIGQTVYARGINDHYVGRIVEILPGRVVCLADASWVADTGAYMSTFVASGRGDGMEIEPVGYIEHAYETLIEWPHRLFAERQ